MLTFQIIVTEPPKVEISIIVKNKMVSKNIRTDPIEMFLDRWINIKKEENPF